MTKNSIVFGGVNSADYNVWISGTDTFAAPQRDVEYVSVPGRNGDLIIDNGKWNNIQITYPAFINKEFYTQMAAFRAEICKLRGYQRLEDTYHPDEYRLASFSRGLDPKISNSFFRSGEFDITFNCKPQRFLKSGEVPIQLMPPCAMANKIYSQYVTVGGDSLQFEVTCAVADTLTINIKTYDSDGTQLTTTDYTCTNGDSETVTFANTDIYWRMTISGQSDVDEVAIRIKTIALYDSEALVIDAIMARTWWITNPTGYAAKPKFEVYHKQLADVSIENYVNNSRLDYYVFHVNDTGVSHFYMDCDMQYVYDDSHNNLTNKLFLTTAQSDVGEGLVFPQLGEGDIKCTTSYSTTLRANGIGLINIFPYWWRL